MSDNHKGPGRGVSGAGKSGPGKSGLGKSSLGKGGLGKGPPKVERAGARGHAGKAVVRLAHEVRHERPLHNWGAAKGGASTPGAGATYRDPTQGGSKGPFGKV